MNIFIDTPQRAAERAERVRRQCGGQQRAGARYGGAATVSAESAGVAAISASGATRWDFDLDEVPGCEFMERDGAGMGAGRGSGTGARPREGARLGSDIDAGMRRIPRGYEPQSAAADAYRDEKAYDRKRVRRRKRGHVLRLLALIVLMPIVIVAVFLVSYVLTCVLNGATPDEVMASLGNLMTRVEGFLIQLGML